MNRVEFMTELAMLLQDIPAEERREAMQYYNDYFDDAGITEEANIIKELGSPEKVAKEVKSSLLTNEDTVHEYRETGYTDTTFEQKESPVKYRENTNSEQAQQNTYRYTGNKNTTPAKNDSSKIWKIVLIVILALFAIPIIVPVLAGILAAIAGILIAIVMVFMALVIASASIAFAGAAMFVAGLVTLIEHFAAGLVLTGSGMILAVLGVIATVASVKLCILIFPAIAKGIVWICKKPFTYRKAAI